MFRSMCLALGMGALAVCLGIGTNASAQSQNMTTSTSSGTGMTSGSMYKINWSHRFMLTPLEHKRLRAMGLTDKEVYGVANAAQLSGRDVYDVAQMVLRGRSFWQIARDVGVPYDLLDDVNPEWQTAEWDQAVREGWYTHRPYGTPSSSMGTTGSGSTSH